MTSDEQINVQARAQLAYADSPLLPHTERVGALLKRARERSKLGDPREAGELRDRAAKLQNERVSAELERAKREPINLSDLMGGREAFTIDEIERTSLT